MILLVVDKTKDYEITRILPNNIVEKVSYSDFIIDIFNKISHEVKYPTKVFYCNGDPNFYDDIIKSIDTDTEITGVISFGSDPYKVISNSTLMSNRIKKPNVLDAFYEKKQFLLSPSYGEVPYWACVNPNNFTRNMEPNYLDFTEKWNRLFDLCISVVNYLEVKRDYE